MTFFQQKNIFASWRGKVRVSSAVVLAWTLLFGVASSNAADVEYYGAIKSIMYDQQPGASPVLMANGVYGSYGFNAFVFAENTGVLTNATVKRSGSASVYSLTPQTNDMIFRYERWFETQAALDSAFPSGSLLRPESYSFTIGTRNDGTRTASVGFSLLLVPLSYPSTPHVNNLIEAQSIDTTRDFVVQWAPLNASSVAIVQLTVFDTASNVVFMTPAPFSPGALTSSSTSAVIPAHTLPSDTLLQAHLSVGNPGMPNTESYPGAVGVAALGKDTQFAMATRPRPATPRLSASLEASGQFKITIITEPNQPVQVEYSTNAVHWFSFAGTNSQQGTVVVTDSATTEAARFYRARLGP